MVQAKTISKRIKIAIVAYALWVFWVFFRTSDSYELFGFDLDRWRTGSLTLNLFFPLVISVFVFLAQKWIAKSEVANNAETTNILRRWKFDRPKLRLLLLIFTFVALPLLWIMLYSRHGDTGRTTDKVDFEEFVSSIRTEEAEEYRRETTRLLAEGFKNEELPIKMGASLPEIKYENPNFSPSYTLCEKIKVRDSGITIYQDGRLGCHLMLENRLVASAYRGSSDLESLAAGRFVHPYDRSRLLESWLNSTSNADQYESQNLLAVNAITLNEMQLSVDLNDKGYRHFSFGPATNRAKIFYQADKIELITISGGIDADFTGILP